MMARKTLAVVAALASLAFAAPAFAQDINVYSMDETCRTDPAYEQHCFVLPESYGPSITLGEFVQGNENLMKYIIEFNGWHGATTDLVIPAGVYFRAA